MNDRPDEPPPEPEVHGGKSVPPLSGRDLQENEGEVDAPPGSDADQAAEVPHVG